MSSIWLLHRAAIIRTVTWYELLHTVTGLHSGLSLPCISTCHFHRSLAVHTTVKHMHVGYRSHLPSPFQIYIQHYVHVYIRMYVRTIMYTCTAHIVSIRTCSKGILRFYFKATSRHRHRYMLLHYCVCRVMYACWHVLHVPCKPYGGEVSPA